MAGDVDRHTGTGQRYELAAETTRRGNPYFLAKDRANSRLECLPGAGGAQSRAARDERRKTLIAFQMRADRLDVRVEIEKPPQARDDREQCAHLREPDGRDEAIAAGCNFHAADGFVDGDRAAVAVVGHP